MTKFSEKLASVTRIGLDLAKNVFQIHGVDAAGNVVVTRKLRRGVVLEFFGQLPRCLVAMEACGSAHHWGREISALGHEVRLIPPAHVKPYVRRNKTDAADAAGGVTIYILITWSGDAIFYIVDTDVISERVQ